MNLKLLDKIILKSSALHKNTFEKGNTDYFEVDAPNVGDIKKIRYEAKNLNKLQNKSLFTNF